MSPVVRLEGVGRTFRTGSRARPVEVRALVDVSLTLARGSYTALMGPSGSGKSTLMNVIGLLDTPSAGRYWLGGQDVSHLSERARALTRGREVGFVFQAFFLLPRLRALDNVALPLIYQGVPDRERRQRARAALDAVGLTDRVDHLPNELSGGQKQRVAIARALVTRPDLLLADEPTGALDSRAAADILALFDELHAQGRTIIVVTHEPEVGARAGRIVRLRDGRIVEGA